MAKNRKHEAETEPKDVYASELDFEDFPCKKSGKSKAKFHTSKIDAWEVLEDERQVVAEFFL